ncbi:hypothetical protein AAEU38_13250 [Bacteroides thetaiotaomicron]|uniref:hypothetical protein n=1 Tax=Bacteroides thetaiotaomicron TaxID=818 RepID=UPI00313DCB30
MNELFSVYQEDHSCDVDIPVEQIENETTYEYGEKSLHKTREKPVPSNENEQYRYEQKRGKLAASNLCCIWMNPYCPVHYLP